MRPTDISPISQVMRRIDLAAEETVPQAGPRDAFATGFPSLDRWVGGGVRAGDLVVLAGAIGSGKSALTLAMALRMAEVGTKVAVVSGEMTVERQMERALAIEGRVRVDDLRQGRLDDASRAAVGAVAVRLRDHGPRLEVMPPEGFEGLTALLRAHPVDVLIVDPIQALLAGRADPDAALASMIRQLKALALAHHLCIMAVSHLPHWTPRPDPRPVLEDLGAMGAIQESADVVLALFREEMYTPDHGVEGATELLVRKHRNGSLGYLDLYFYKQWLRFEDMLDPDR